MSVLIPGEVTLGREEEVQRRTMAAAPSLCWLPGQQCGYQPRGAHTFPGCLPNPGAGLGNGAFAFPELFNIPLEQAIVSRVRQEPLPPPPAPSVEPNLEIKFLRGSRREGACPEPFPLTLPR